MKWTRALIVLALAVWLLAWAGPAAAQGAGEGTVVRDNFVLAPGEVFENDLVVLAGQAHLQAGSTVRGDVAALGGTVVIEGSVTGDVVVFSGDLTLGPAAEIEGDLVNFGQLTRDPGARVYGKVVEGGQSEGGLARLSRMLAGLGERMSAQMGPVAPEGAPSRLGGVLGSVASLAVLAVLALVVMSLLPGQVTRVSQAMTTSAPLCFGVGVLTVVLAMLLVPLLTITIIGIPVALALALAVAVCILVGWVAAGRVVAQAALQALRVRAWSPLAVALAGTLLISLAAKVPWVGGLAAFVLVTWSVGAAVLTRLGTASQARWGSHPDAHTPPSGSGQAPPTGQTKRLDPGALAPVDSDSF